MRSKAVTGFLIRHAGLVCAAFTLMVLVCAWLAQFFEINASAETLLVKDNRLYLQSEIYSQRFDAQEFILVGYRPRKGNLFDTQTLRTIESLRQELTGLERVEKVNAITSVPLIAPGDNLSPDMDVSKLTWTPARYSQDDLQRILADHPIYTDLLINKAQTATALQIVFKDDPAISDIDGALVPLQQAVLDDTLSDAQRRQMENLQQDKDRLEKRLEATRNGEIRQIYEIVAPYREDAAIYLGGTHVLAYHLVEIISRDLVVFGLAILAIVSALLLLLFRNWRWLFLPLLCCLASVVITVGLFGALGLETTVISSNFIALQLILTLAIVIHLVVHYRYLQGEQPEADHKTLLIDTVSAKAQPCFFAGLTTSVGFASLLISGLQPVISFGWMMIVAMTVSIAVSLVLFPCVLALFSAAPATGNPSVFQACLDWTCRQCRNHPRWIVVLSAVFTLGMGAGVLRLAAENSFINYFRDDTQIHEELSFIDTRLGGSTPLDIIYHPQSPEPESQDLVLDAGDAKILQAVQQSLEHSDAVGKVMSVVNFTRLAKSMNQGEPLTEYELNSLYLVIEKSLRESLLGAYLDTTHDDYRINARIIDSTPGLDRRAFVTALRRSLDTMGLPEDSYSLTNLFVIYQDILQRLVDSQVKTIGLVFVALWLVMLGIFRSPVVAAITLLPNVVVTAFILGLMGWMGIPLDLMTITIAAIAMGIAVDDSIHFVHRFMQSRDAPAAERSRTAFGTVGYAIVYTSLVIAVGFSVLGFSDFVPSVVFGLLTCVAMVVALVIDLTLLPVLLSGFVNRRTSAGA